MEARFPDRGKRRGRRSRRPDPDSGVVEAFANRLWRLRRKAGDPPYAEMASRLGAAASKSSLASAVQGRRLPSWETTWEFVRVLAVDRLGCDPKETEREWRELWERTKAADSADGSGAVGGVSHEVVIVGTDDMPADALSAGSVKVVIVPVCSPGPAPWKHVLVNVASAGAVTAGLIFLFADKAREKLLPSRPGSAKNRRRRF